MCSLISPKSLLLCNGLCWSIYASGITRIFLFHLIVVRSEAWIFKIISGCLLKQWYWPSVLLHLPLVPHICVAELGRHWFWWWLVACLATSHYLNKWWLFIYHNPRDRLNRLSVTKLPLRSLSAILMPCCWGGDEWWITEYITYRHVHSPTHVFSLRREHLYW